MKINPLLFVVIAIAALLASCGPGEKLEGSFTDEELSWLVYKDGDNLLFQNPDSIGDEVTLFVSSQKDPNQKRTYYPIEAEVTVGNPEQGDYFKVYLLKDERDFKHYLKFGEVYRSFDLIEPLAEYRVGDIVYKDVYLFSEGSSAPSSNMKNVFFAKNYGVVQYTTKDGRDFYLLNNELTELPR